MFIGKRGRAFNPRSYKRSDHIRTVVTARYATFNPRSYKRSDMEAFSKNYYAFFLSIHAPTRGATLSFLLLFWNPLSFNPRSYKRSDSEDQKRMITIYTFNPRSYKRSDKGQTSMFALIFFFQSTLLQEERLCKRVCIFNVSTFNPRSYKRSDKQSA